MTELKVILHAPTAAAFQRAKSNAMNLKAARPDAQIRIVVNGDAVTAATATRDLETDSCLLFCQNSLKKHNLQAPADIETTQSGVATIVELQQQGWQYIRS